MFIVTLGCRKVLCFGHIDPDFGIFGILEEKFRRVILGVIIPAKENTSCKCRRTKKCNIDCKYAVHRIVSLGKVSDRQTGLRI